MYTNTLQTLMSNYNGFLTDPLSLKTNCISFSLTNLHAPADGSHLSSKRRRQQNLSLALGPLPQATLEAIFSCCRKPDFL